MIIRSTMTLVLALVGVPCALWITPPASLAADKKKSGAAPSTATPKASVKSSSLLPTDEEFRKQPTYIKSDTLHLNQTARTFKYQGSVEVTQGDMVLTADTVDGSYDETNRIKDLVASKNVTIVKGPEIRATSQRATYDAAKQIMVLTENPEIQQGASNLSADVIRIFMAENRSSAEGQVRVKLVTPENAKSSASDSLR